MGWSDLENEDKSCVVNFAFDNLLPDGEYENWKDELESAGFKRVSNS